jgi:hypothetical protein
MSIRVCGSQRCVCFGVKVGAAGGYTCLCRASQCLRVHDSSIVPICHYLFARLLSCGVFQHVTVSSDSCTHTCMLSLLVCAVGDILCLLCRELVSGQAVWIRWRRSQIKQCLHMPGLDRSLEVWLVLDTGPGDYLAGSCLSCKLASCFPVIYNGLMLDQCLAQIDRVQQEA